MKRETRCRFFHELAVLVKQNTIMILSLCYDEHNYCTLSEHTIKKKVLATISSAQTFLFSSWCSVNQSRLWNKYKKNKLINQVALYGLTLPLATTQKAWTILLFPVIFRQNEGSPLFMHTVHSFNSLIKDNVLCLRLSISTTLSQSKISIRIWSPSRNQLYKYYIFFIF